MMYELFWPLSLMIVVGLVAETATGHALRCWRLARLRSRRACRRCHTWGRRFGPFKPPDERHWYWGWKCSRCPATKTEVMGSADASAHVYFRSHGVQLSEEGWAVIQASLDKKRAEDDEARARKVVSEITG